MFTFDYVAPQESGQEEVFTQIAQPITDSCLQGYNGTIFAYGMTGSGKTFTIQGPAFTAPDQTLDTFLQNAESLNFNLYEQRGLMQRSFEHIFQCIEQEKVKAEQQGNEVKYLIKSSYLEIYNEQVMDLLEPTQTNLPIREDIKTGVYVEGLQEEPVQSAKELIQLITRGAQNRKTGSTNMNEKSSRSHSVLTTIIESKTLTQQGVWQMRSSRFHIIDLAGSERNKQTNAEGQRLKEAGMINKSLSALGIVINSLVDKSEGKTRHVHYRDSKLTFLLRDSLGGNSKTVIIANITQSQGSVSETLSTLQFAQRAKLIKNKAVINEESSGTIEILKAEIRRLKQQMAEQQRFQNEQPKKSPHIDFTCQKCQSESGLQPTNQLESNDSNDSSKPTRISQLESLLSACLENLTSSQKHFDSELEKRQTQVKQKQQALEQSEKAFQRDKMIIKFRDQRILTLENQLKDSDHTNCSKAYEEQITQLREERDLYKSLYEKQEVSMAAKLFSEKEDLNKKCESLLSELSQTPDSLTAQVTRLTELTESLNIYLKEHCEQTQQKQLEQQVAELTSRLQEKNFQILDSTQQLEQLQDQIEKLKQTHTEEMEVAKRSYTELEQLSQHQQQQLRVSFSENLKSLKAEIQNDSQSQQQQLRVSFLEEQNKLQQQLESLQQELQKSEKQELEANKQVLALEASLQKADSELETALDEMKKTKQSHQEELQSLQLKMKQNQDQHSQSLQESQRELLQSLSELEALQKSHDESKDKLSSQQTELNDIEKENILLKEQVNQLQDANKTVQSEFQQTKANLQKQIDESQQEKQKQLTCHQWEIESLTNNHSAEVQQLQAEIQSQKLANEQAEQQVTQLQNQQLSLIQNVETLRTELKDLESQKQEETEKLRSEMENQEQHHLEMKATLLQSRDNLEQEFEQAKKDFEEKENAYREDIEVIQAKFVQLETQIGNQDAENLKLSRLQSSELDAKSKEIAQLRSELAQLESALEEEQTQRQNFEQKLEDLLKEYDDLQEKSNQNQESSHKTLSETQQDLAHHQDQLSSVKQQLVQYKKDCSQAQQELAKTRTDSELQVQKLVNQLKEKELENMQLQGQQLLTKTESQQQKQQYERRLEQLQESLAQALDQEKAVMQRQQAFKIEEAVFQAKSEAQKVAEQQLKDQINLTKNQYKQQLDSEFQQQLQVAISQSKLETRQQLAAEFEHQLQVQIQLALQNQQHQTSQSEKQLHSLVSMRANHCQQSCQFMRQELESLKQICIQQKNQFKRQIQQQCTALMRVAEDHNEKLQDTQEQLMEYKMLTGQLQQEKQQQLKVADTLSNMLKQAEQALIQQAQQSQTNKNEQNMQQYESLINALQHELETLRRQNLDQSTELAKQRGIIQDLQHKLQQAKQQTDQLIQQENALMDELQNKIGDLGANSEKWRLKCEQLKRKNEDLTQKNTDIQQKLDFIISQQSKGAAQDPEVFELKNELQKREHEIREIVRTLKRYSEDKKVLEAENQQLLKQISQDSSTGHQNLQQKIHHHEKIKLENNKLREENYQLKEELRKAMSDSFQSQGSGVAHPHTQQLYEQSKRDCLLMVETMDNLLQQALQAPGAASLIQQMPKLKEALQKAQSQSADSRHALLLQKQKAIVIQEIILNLGRTFQQLNKQQKQPSQARGNSGKDQQYPHGSLNLSRPSKPVEQQIQQASSYLQQQQR